MFSVERLAIDDRDLFLCACVRAKAFIDTHSLSLYGEADSAIACASAASIFVLPVISLLKEVWKGCGCDCMTSSSPACPKRITQQTSMPECSGRMFQAWNRRGIRGWLEAVRNSTISNHREVHFVTTVHCRVMKTAKKRGQFVLELDNVTNSRLSQGCTLVSWSANWWTLPIFQFRRQSWPSDLRAEDFFQEWFVETRCRIWLLNKAFLEQVD